MAKVEKYYCDRCGDEIKEYKNKLTLYANPLYSVIFKEMVYSKLADLCGQCYSDVVLFSTTNPSRPKPEPEIKQTKKSWVRWPWGE